MVFHPSSRVSRDNLCQGTSKLFWWWLMVAQHLTKTLYVGFFFHLSPVRMSIYVRVCLRGSPCTDVCLLCV